MPHPSKRTSWVSRRIWLAFRQSGYLGARFNHAVDSHMARRATYKASERIRSEYAANLALQAGTRPSGSRFV